jgi:hypothetical protein
VHFRNLNGHTGFDLLMFYSICIMVAAILVFCFAITVMRDVTKENQALVVLNENAVLWNETYHH